MQPGSCEGCCYWSLLAATLILAVPLLAVEDRDGQLLGMLLLDNAPKDRDRLILELVRVRRSMTHCGAAVATKPSCSPLT